ncbi:binding partner of ACD11 1-like protein [Cinnamomum micranthum f. kanehirae]|uniref:Binding partner of ACD11 1-like protein n=1 Tax=Cinnamomum micranthum f. kanehirae TaxID=337451 RepID=A0A3S3NGS5_9MAGN|nr:binding partner of ACD11 1-like protein [Cinnamomum micranthum f. kanehirae]
MSIKTVTVSNVSLRASEQDLKEFFSFSGDIEYVEMQSTNEESQIAHVTFKDPQGAETALLLSGSTIADRSVTIAPASDYQLPPTASAPPAEKKAVGGAESAVQKAEDVVASMLAKGFILGKDALSKAKELDEKHQFTSTASAKVADLDKRIGLSEKISVGTTVVNDKFKEMDQKYQVSEKTKSALTAAEQKVSDAGSAIIKNRYIFTGASWVTGAFNRVAKAAGEVGSKTKEKVAGEEKAAGEVGSKTEETKTKENEAGEVVSKTKEKETGAEEEQVKGVMEDVAKVHMTESPKAAATSEHSPKHPTAEGLMP